MQGLSLYQILGGNSQQLIGKGILYVANSAWLLGSLILSTSLYIVHYTRVSAIYRRQALSMVIGAIGAVAGYSTYAIGLVPWDLDLGPMIIALNSSIFAFGILYFVLLDVSPIARDRLFESMQEGSEKTLEELMKEADHSLYIAKNSGRNRACFASEKG